MSAPGKNGSPVATFFVIYLAISLAVGTATFFVVKDYRKRNAVVMRADETVLCGRDPSVSGEATPAEPPSKAATAAVPKTSKETPATEADKPDEFPRPVTPEPKEEPPLSEEEIAEIERLYPFPEIQPLLEIVNNWVDVPKHAYPKLVAIHRSVDFEVEQGGKVVARGTLPSGSMMTPTLLAGDQLTLTSGHAVPVTVTLPVQETDFKEQIEAKYNAFVRKSRESVIARREAEVQRRIGDLTREDNLADWNDGNDPRFDVAKESLSNGDVGIYSLHEAKQWRWGGAETIDGTEFESAYVLIVSEAAFGVTERELKVLLLDGEVVLWVDPATGAEI